VERPKLIVLNISLTPVARSVTLGVSAVTVIYILANLAFLLVLSAEEIKSSEVGNILVFLSCPLPLSPPCPRCLC
jgi:hypothetical protein